ncbi:phosphoribosylformylglycinamidine synthase subunit PurS [bacterium]|nr:phosphoribosylformylglycinamidine synthase subunit PurS [bacterium]MBU1613723.1 phosphoribosylformylglycinamidine synthase subunit PurS [bacterium]
MNTAEVELFVKLKTPDLVALTARHTLIKEMGYEDILEDLTRQDYYRFKINLEEKRAEEIVKEIALNSKIFVNPNKHTYRIGKWDDPQKRVPRSGKWEEIKVLTFYLEDGQASLMKETLWNTYGYKEVSDLQRGTLWSFALREKDREKAKKIVREIVLTTSSKKGLLINPHCQDYRIL